MHFSQLARNITSSTKAKITREADSDVSMDVRDVRQDVSEVSERFVPQENLSVMSQPQRYPFNTKFTFLQGQGISDFSNIVYFGKHLKGLSNTSHIKQNFRIKTIGEFIFKSVKQSKRHANQRHGTSLMQIETSKENVWSG